MCSTPIQHFQFQVHFAFGSGIWVLCKFGLCKFGFIEIYVQKGVCVNLGLCKFGSGVNLGLCKFGSGVNVGCV